MKMRHMFLLALILLTGCARPLMMRRPIGLSPKQRMLIEKTLREVEQAHRTLAARNLISYIRRYIGTPYQYGGLSPAGMDCSGFVMLVFKQAFGIELPRSTKAQYSTLQPVSPYELKFGDLVFFENTRGAGVSHVGIFLMNAKFAHASTSVGVTVSDLTEPYYQSRYLGARRISNLTFD